MPTPALNNLNAENIDVGARPQSLDCYDVAVVGAGVVGCAMARRFTLDGARVIVLEKAADILDGASKGNSAILHTGFDAPANSLEQACVARGYKEFLNIHEGLGLPVLKAGALVLAWSEEQLGKLPDLIKKAERNGVLDVVPLSKKEILEREQMLSNKVCGGFNIPGEFLIDPWATAHSYILQALANGAQLTRNTEVLTGDFDGDKWRIETSKGDVHAISIVTCAGLYGDVVDHRLTGKKTFTVKPRKGQFVVFDKAASALTSSIILPIPTKTTKGVVVCRTIFGNLLVGPTSDDQNSRTDASTTETAISQLRAKGIEIFPDLENYDVTATYAGLRPATEYQDYQIHHLDNQNYVSVGGIRSTGLSAALGIASFVAELVGAELSSAWPIENPAIPEPDRLSNYHRRDWEAPGNGGVVCHCELVTRREIEQVLSGPLPPATLQGLKRRTRVCMGRCQGFYCTGELAEMTAGYLDPPIGCRHDDH